MDDYGDECRETVAELRQQLSTARMNADAARSSFLAMGEERNAALARAEQAEAMLADLQQYTAACEATGAEWRERCVKAEAALVKLVGQYDAFCLRAVQAEQRAEQAEAALAQLRANWATIPLDDLHQIANESQLASWSSVRYLRDWLASLEA